jgi:protein-tyrosine phosphatase
MNLVVKLSSGGSLHQGDKNDLARFDEDPAWFNMVASDKTPLLVIAAEELDISAPSAKIVEGYKVPLFDTLIGIREQNKLAKILRPTIRNIVKALKNGRRVVICCAQGLNRSGLLSGLVLRELGYTGPVALKLIRDARGPRALFNSSFEEMVLRGA